MMALFKHRHKQRHKCALSRPCSIHVRLSGLQAWCWTTSCTCSCNCGFALHLYEIALVPLKQADKTCSRCRISLMILCSEPLDWLPPHNQNRTLFKEGIVVGNAERPDSGLMHEDLVCQQVGPDIAQMPRGASPSPMSWLAVTGTQHIARFATDSHCQAAPAMYACRQAAQVLAPTSTYVRKCSK